MDKQKKLIAGGIAAGLGLSALIYYLSDDGKGDRPAQVQSLRLDETIAILKDFKKELSASFITLASFAMSIKEQTGNKISDDQIKEILSTQSPIHAQIKRAENKVYDKHSTTEEVVKYAVEELHKDNPEVKELTKEMKTNLENAYRGKPPEMRSDLPSFMTSERTLKVLEEMYEVTKAVTYFKIEELKEQGIQVNPYSEQFMRATQDMEAETEKEKFKVFEANGLTASEETPGMLLHNAIQKYSQSDQIFARKVMMIEDGFRTSMQNIMQGSISAEDQARLKLALKRSAVIEELPPGEQGEVQDQEQVEEIKLA